MFNEKSVLAVLETIRIESEKFFSPFAAGPSDIMKINTQLGGIIKNLNDRLWQETGRKLPSYFVQMVKEAASDTTSELYAAMNEAEIETEVAPAHTIIGTPQWLSFQRDCLTTTEISFLVKSYQRKAVEWTSVSKARRIELIEAGLVTFDGRTWGVTDAGKMIIQGHDEKGYENYNIKY